MQSQILFWLVIQTVGHPFFVRIDQKTQGADQYFDQTVAE